MTCDVDFKKVSFLKVKKVLVLCIWFWCLAPVPQPKIAQTCKCSQGDLHRVINCLAGLNGALAPFLHNYFLNKQTVKS
jgi:uncharacterized membrane protein YwzB